MATDTNLADGLTKCPILRGKANYFEWKEVIESNLYTVGC